MLLAVDVGNTNTVFGLCDPTASHVLVTWRAATRPDQMPDEWYAILAPLLAGSGFAVGNIQAAIVSSVVPSVTRWLSAMCRERLHLEPIIVGVDLDLGLRVLLDNPGEVGADRLVNSVAAYHRYGGPCIAIDFGTATNFDVVSAEGDYLGGALAPGMIIALEALAGRAARLFSVDLVLPPRAIGKNTITAMQSGLVLGYLAMIEGMVTRIQEELGTPATVVVTGGYAEIFAAASPLIAHHDPDLTIDGLRLVYQRVTASSLAAP